MSKILYPINPDRNTPWNDLPLLPIKSELYHTIEILEKLGDAKAALARLHGRSAVIPNQGLLVNAISLQEAKISSEIENVFTTDDELYRAFSDQNTGANGASKEVLRYREALWSGYNYLKNKGKFDINYFIQVFHEIKETSEGIRPAFSNTSIKQGGSGPNAGSTDLSNEVGVFTISSSSAIASLLPKALSRLSSTMLAFSQFSATRSISPLGTKLVRT